jgi:hypothetical protein
VQREEGAVKMELEAWREQQGRRVVRSGRWALAPFRTFRLPVFHSGMLGFRVACNARREE